MNLDTLDKLITVKVSKWNVILTPLICYRTFLAELFHPQQKWRLNDCLFIPFHHLSLMEHTSIKQPTSQPTIYPVIHPCSGAEWNGKRIELIFGGLISLA